MNSKLVEIIIGDISSQTGTVTGTETATGSGTIPGPVNIQGLQLSCVTCAEMKAIEKAADAAGLSYYQMMENAGTMAAELILSELSKADWVPAYDVVFDLKPQVLVFCGKGNNGGDGFVVARQLYLQGFPVSVILVEGSPTTPDAIANDRLLPKSIERISVQTFLETRLDAFPVAFSGIIVDAIYGTGFHGTLPPKVAKVVEWINRSPSQQSELHSSGVPNSSTRHAGKMVISLDLPSGLSGDMKSDDLLPELCVKADHTIVFHELKPVHLSIAAQPFLGKITLADIGINAVLK
jgi:NAD(P)H-hydrate epimerase